MNKEEIRVSIGRLQMIEFYLEMNERGDLSDIDVVFMIHSIAEGECDDLLMNEG